MQRTIVSEPRWNDAADDSARLRLLVEDAILAPSGHNTQPWLFRVRDEALELLADRTRALPVVDPDDRELTISVGAALAHVRVAAARFGRLLAIELLPEPGDPDVLARVRLGPAMPADRAAMRLHEAMAHRFTDRGPYVQAPIDPAALDAIVGHAEVERAWLAVITDDARKAALADSIAEGDRLQMRDARFRRELAAWMHPNRSRHRDGLPGYAFGSSDFMSAVSPLVVRLFDVGKGQAARDRELAERSPALLVLGTNDDTPRAWLEAGQALAYAWLEATARGISMSFLNQPVELPELRADVALVVGHAGFPQLVMRLGAPEGERDPRRSPRRPVEQVLID
jgi:nitroreductase